YVQTLKSSRNSLISLETLKNLTEAIEKSIKAYERPGISEIRKFTLTLGRINDTYFYSNLSENINEQVFNTLISSLKKITDFDWKNFDPKSCDASDLEPAVLIACDFMHRKALGEDIQIKDCYALAIAHVEDKDIKPKPEPVENREVELLKINYKLTK